MNPRALNRDALFSDGSAAYVVPSQPQVGQAVTIRLRTARNGVDRAYILTAGHTKTAMKKSYSRGMFDYYEVTFVLIQATLRYSFVVNLGNEHCYYNRFGAFDTEEHYYDFRIIPGFQVPQWAMGAVIYQIMVDRFYNGDPTNDVLDNEYIYIGQPTTQVKQWDEPPASMDVRRFYGGDLAGVLQKLDYLQALGVEVIYFNPLFVSPSNHKYDIQDYDYIDPHLGVVLDDEGELLSDEKKLNKDATRYQSRVTSFRNLQASNQLFIELVEQMHQRGMKVIIDGVFNHCGSFNKWMDRERIYEGKQGYKDGAFISHNSDYRSYFRFFKEEDEDWPYNTNYDGWWAHDTLPKLNYESGPLLPNYILSIARKWVSPPYNCDGWRLDVAADLGYSNDYNHKFWKRFREVVKTANPEALILAEHYGDPADWLQGDEWDTIMNYDAFMEPVSWFFTGMDKHSDQMRRDDLLGNADSFVRSIVHNMAAMPTPSLYVSMNQLSNHDHSRFLTRTNGKAGRVDYWGSKAAGEGINLAVMREAVLFQFTWLGAPTIYYGDEAGVVGFTDPDNRRTYPWGHENKTLIAYHRDLIRIHRDSSALRTGSLCVLWWEQGFVSFARFNEEEQYVIAINHNRSYKEVRIPVWLAELPQRGLMKRMMYTFEKGYTVEVDKVQIRDGEVVLNMGPHSAMILRNARPWEFVSNYWKS